MNAEDNKANCWNKAITIIRRILVVSVLKTTTSRYRAARAFFAPKSNSLRSPAVHRIGHQPGWLTSCNTGLKVISAHRNSPANRASPAHIIRPLVGQCKRQYKPQWEVSVDEQMIGTKCRIGFRQYLHLKQTKWGIKVWVMADSVSGYYCNLQIYTGREGNDGERGLANRVVKDLLDGYQGRGHHLYVDNNLFFFCTGRIRGMFMHCLPYMAMLLLMIYPTNLS